jgi:predicted enzyme related to lactoylglutathione lyase
MPTRESAPAGAPCWIDLATSDPARSREFYSAMFGWAAEEPNAEFGGYFNFTRNGVRIAGGMASQPGMGPPDAWSVYLATPDADKAVTSAAAHGGQVVVPAMPVGDLGTMAVVTDAGGAAIGAWQPGTHRGFGVYGEDGSPGWFELLTRDYQASVAFYREVFGWDTHVVSDTPEFRYTALRDGEEWLAGIMDAAAFLPGGVPAHWLVYFAVDDTDTAVARLTSLGGAVEQAAADTPYGRIAGAVDPLGARFKLVGPNEAMPARGTAS